MRLLTIAFTNIQSKFAELDDVRYDEKDGTDALKAIAEDLAPLYNPGYIDAKDEAHKNESALDQAFKDLRSVSQQSKSLAETTFTNKGGTQSEGVEAVKSMSTDVEALNQENP